jgi:hypothetical protein
VTRLRDADSAETAFRIKAAVFGFPIGSLAAGLTYLFTQSLLLAIVGFIVLGGSITAAVLYLAERGGRMGASLYRPSGSSTPAVREYSYADSLVARGQHVQAVAAYEEVARQHPTDPEPRLRQARVLRDHLHQYDQAVGVFRQLLHAGVKPQTEMGVLREIVEIHVHKQRQPERALPYLARLGERFKGTPTADWARNEVRAIKAEMKPEHE